LRAFERVYLGMAAEGGVAHSDFDLHGYGIADLVWVSWADPSARDEGVAVSVEAKKLRVVAFELKLKDWRKALQQAFRYSYFADQAIVVLPEDVAIRASLYKATFQELGVGLWSFDKKTSEIIHHVQPNRTHARSATARDKALGSLLSLSELSKLKKTR
jgi:hypothetical protein